MRNCHAIDFKLRCCKARAIIIIQICLRFKHKNEQPPTAQEEKALLTEDGILRRRNSGVDRGRCAQDSGEKHLGSRKGKVNPQSVRSAQKGEEPTQNSV